MRKLILSSLIFSLLALAAACNTNSGSGSAKTIASGRIGNLTATLANAEGVLKHGAEEFTLTFTDAAGKPVDVGAAALNFHMPAMGTMAVMNNAASLTTTGTPGVYRGEARIEMAGEWQAQISYEGPQGTARGSFSVTAQ